VASVKQQHVRADAVAAWIREQAVESDRYLVGLTGAPGSGKSTLASQLSSELAAPVVPMDGFHLPNTVLDERGLRAVKGAPKTFAAADFVDAVARLRVALDDVWLPAFDRTVDEPVADQIRVGATARIVLVEGNYLLLADEPWARLVRQFDAVLFLDVDDDVRFERLVERHVKFGKPRDEAVDFVRTSDERNAALIGETHHRADILVTDLG
jgi:pantothenate kinase